MKKKLFLVGIIVIMLLSLAACVTDNTETHTFVKQEAVSATCDAVGNDEYYTCSHCSKIFDAEKKEITAIPVIPATGHTYVLKDGTSSTCETKGTAEHYECDVCHKLFDLSKENEITSTELDLDCANHEGTPSLVMTTAPAKTEYKAGDAFDVTGMVATYKCDLCEGEIVDNLSLTVVYQAENATAVAMGDEKVTVKMGELSFDIAITVAKADITISGVESEYTVACATAPVINAASSDPNCTIVIEYFDSEGNQVDASDFTVGNVYTARVSVAETESNLAAEVTATIAVEHAYSWAEEEKDVLARTCKCGDKKAARVINNVISYVDDVDMSLDLGALVSGTTDFRINSVKKVLGDGSESEITGEVEENVYTYSLDEYEQTEWTPYDLDLVVNLTVDGEDCTVNYYAKYVEKVIRNAADLDALAYKGGAQASSGGVLVSGYYVLADDIDATGVTVSGNLAFEGSVGFCGMFNGNGHTISNLSVAGYGLFGAIGQNGKIQDVTFENLTVTNDQFALAYVIREGHLTNVTIELSKDTKSFVAARYDVNATFENVAVKTTVEQTKPFVLDTDESAAMPAGISLTYHPYHTVSFATGCDIEIESVRVSDGKKILSPSVELSKTTDDAYWFFEGWTVDGEDWDFSEAITADITVEAKWREVSKTEVDELVNDVKAKISALPDSIELPGNVYFVERILSANRAYEALAEDIKPLIDNYSKLESLLATIANYETVYVQSLAGVDVIPSYVPGGFAKEVGGAASIRQDDLYGNVLTVTSEANGVAAIQFKSFPSISKYSTLYIVMKVTGASCDIYLSDGITNDGWGADWKNTWSISGFWFNDGNWQVLALDLSTTVGGVCVADIFKSNWALGLRTNTLGASFEIADIFGYAAPVKEVSLNVGQITDSGETNENGKIYNLKQGQWFIDNNDANTMINFGVGALAAALPDGFDHFEFWLYNPGDTAYNFHLAGNVNGAWTDSSISVSLTAKAWAKVTISAEDIENNKYGDWYMYIQGGGAALEGWQVSPIYAVKA